MPHEPGGVKPYANKIIIVGPTIEAIDDACRQYGQSALDDRFVNIISYDDLILVDGLPNSTPWVVVDYIPAGGVDAYMGANFGPSKTFPQAQMAYNDNVAIRPKDLMAP